MKSSFVLSVVCSFMLLSACHRDSAAPSLVITGFTPVSAPTGTTVTITGARFNATAANNMVQFNNVTATITSASATQLVVNVPDSATTGKITVTADGQTTVSASNFTVIPSIISSFSPVLGLPGDTVIITGTGFSTVAGNNVVKFANNAMATVTAATATQLTVTVPLAAVAGKGKLSVAVDGQTYNSATTFEVLKDIPRNGLVAYYPFNGNANDTSGNGFNLTLIGICNPVADRFGNPGKAYSFGDIYGGGTNYAVSTNTTAAMVSLPLTVGFWVLYNAYSHSVVFVGKNNATGLGYSCNVANNRMSMRLDSPDYSSSPLAFTGIQWIFFLETFDGSTIKCYTNGSLFESIPVSNSFTATAGKMSIYGVATATVDDVTIYNRILSDAEIQQLYTQTISKK